MALDLEDYHPSVLLHCWLGHLTCKIVSEMTYNVSSGTLNPTIPYHTKISLTTLVTFLAKCEFLSGCYLFTVSNSCLILAMVDHLSTVIFLL